MRRAFVRPSTPSLRLLHRLLAAAAGAAALFASPKLFAQSDLSPPLPDVLLLVDTSGSMEFKTNGEPPVCNPGNPTLKNDRTRWIDLVEVLTGTISNYSCEALDRSSASFVNEYKFGSLDPTDFQYSIPYHRPLSNNCGPGAGTKFGASTNPFVWPTSNAIGFHNFNWGASCPESAFSQIANDGILDSYKPLIRFGLMTFDSSVDPGTGHASGPTTDFASGRNGHWTYVVDDPASGMPYGCTTTPTPPQEVGARNGAAPPWEGRMINFGHPDDGVRAYETKNAQIQQVLLATRPFGATPIAGMLRDAYDFFINDDTTDLNPIGSPASGSPESKFGPKDDPYLACGRDRVVLLLTDGLPNMDLRPACLGPGGNETLCPFKTPEATAAMLLAKKIPTYVVGFALDSATQDGTSKACSAVNCDPVTSESAPALQACCTLRKIAVAGGGTAAFAADKASLRSQIHKILSRSINTTSRTQPTVGSGSSGAGSVRIFSGFEPGLHGTKDEAGRPWAGVLDRQRWECKPDPTQGNILVPRAQEVKAEEGDRFVMNVGKAGANDRVIYTYVGGNGATDDVFSRRTMRPLLADVSPGDGVGSYGAKLFGRLSQSFTENLDVAALAIEPADCFVGGSTLLPPACRDHYMKWLLGFNNGTEFTRCKTAGPECQLIGDIFHSTPQIVGPPTSLTRDESYARFSYEQAERPAVLYTSSNDGFLHAFAVDTPGKGNASNELWAFIPPATLPNLHTQYPYAHQFLLDGVPVITDVVAVEKKDALPVAFERTEAAAEGDTNTWRTVLVQSFGRQRPGYFALDVTNPVPDKTSLQDSLKGGPRLLWQLTDSVDKVNLFGAGGATPAITTLFFDPEIGGNAPREIPVAVLPGGPGGTVVAGESDERTFDNAVTGYKPRGHVRKYDFGTKELGARSLTIVRLDTGEVIRTFRQDDTDIANEDLKKRVTEVPQLDSPVTGQPVAFPGIVGAVADRIFVGDNDGRLWKIDVSARSPKDWTMKLFFDLYPSELNGSSSGLTSADGQPVMTVPVLSVDEIGNVTVNIATGDQDQLGSQSTQRNFVWSLTDTVNPVDLSTKPVVNWYKELKSGDTPDGTRAVGPLALFNGYLYFAAFRPATAGSKACRSGQSTVWGMHYLERKTKLSPGDGGAPAPNFPEQFVVQSDDAVVFGVSVVQQPSCYESADETAGDDFLGFGSQRRFAKVQSGQFQLVMHMGDTPQGTGKSNKTESGVSSGTINLAAPNSASTVTGWASVLE